MAVMSCSGDKEEALKYVRRSKAKVMFEVHQGMTARGAGESASHRVQGTGYRAQVSQLVTFVPRSQSATAGGASNTASRLRAACCLLPAACCLLPASRLLPPDPLSTSVLAPLHFPPVPPLSSPGVVAITRWNLPECIVPCAHQR